VRDLTDPEQNRRVLDLASCLVEDPSASRSTSAGVDVGEDPAVLAEARAAARSRRRLTEVAGPDGRRRPVHLSVVWAMYGETGRMVPKAVHPHGEDFVRAKVDQLDWLSADLPGVTWSILACDDGCPDEPSSAEVMAGIIAAEDYPATGHRSVRVIRLADVLAEGAAGRGVPAPALGRLTSTDDSRKGGSILSGLHAVLASAPVPGWDQAAGRHLVCSTDADLSANLAQLGSLTAQLLARPAPPARP